MDGHGKQALPRLRREGLGEGVTNDDVLELITDLRGGEPEACDFCGEVAADGEYAPEEGGLWACMRCWDKFNAEDAE